MNLNRSLLLRISLFALGLFVLSSALVLYQAQARIRESVGRSGDSVQRLLALDTQRGLSAFERDPAQVDLTRLTTLGELVSLCAQVTDIYGRPVASQCFGGGQGAPPALRWLLGRIVGPDVAYHGVLGKYPGVKIADLVVTPNLDSEAGEVWSRISTLLWVALGILLLNYLVVMPVRRALRPTEQILAGLARMEAGDLTVRLPRFELIELQKISTVFNLLAGRLQATMDEQRQLTARLLTVREEERRHLARELHDEFGQCLTSINAEAAYANELAGEGLPALLPCTQAIARTAAHMMEALQGLLERLRPVGLDEFGLVASLENLVAQWNRHGHGRCRYRLRCEGDLAGLADDLNVSVYRIVQESLTNATRHGRASEVTVHLARAGGLELSIEDDGEGVPPQALEPGRGLLGMSERVRALGGRFEFSARQPGGSRVWAWMPLPATETGP